MADNPMFLKSTNKLRDEFLEEWRQFKITQGNGREILFILEEFCRRGKEWERLVNENADLRLQLQQARDHMPPPHIENPSGLLKYWFNEHTGVYKADDTFHERACRWAHGPYDDKHTAEVEWGRFRRKGQIEGHHD